MDEGNKSDFFGAVGEWLDDALGRVKAATEAAKGERKDDEIPTPKMLDAVRDMWYEFGVVSALAIKGATEASPEMGSSVVIQITSMSQRIRALEDFYIGHRTRDMVRDALKDLDAQKDAETEVKGCGDPTCAACNGTFGIEESANVAA